MPTPAAANAPINPAMHRSPALRRLRPFLHWWPRHPSFSILLLAALAFTLCVAMALQAGIAPPIVPDEFSYLLAADTFAHGRLANPPHPFWQAFESLHILQQPTYASMYPPAQGMILALGQALTGHAYVGVWLSMAVMAGAFCWMLWAWVPPRWAIVGTLVGVVQFGLYSSWSRSYWGGAVAAAGGALLFGAFRRLVRRWWMRDGIVLGLGLFILANSRPYEGLVVSVPALAIVAWKWWRVGKGSHPPLPSGEGGVYSRRVRAWKTGEPRNNTESSGDYQILPTPTPSPGRDTGHPLPAGEGQNRHPYVAPATRAILPLLAILLLGATWTGYYNWRVTGNPLLLPWRLHYQQYSIFPVFLWQKPRPEPVYHSPDLRLSYVVDEMSFYQLHLGPGGLWRETAIKLKEMFDFFFGPALVLSLLAFPWALRNRWVLFAGGTLLLLIVANLLTVASFSHYLAPGASLLLVILTACLRRIWRVPWAGRAAVVLLLLLSIPSVLGRFPLSGLYVTPGRYYEYGTAYKSTWAQQRQGFIDTLRTIPGQHLILVQYSHHGHEWIANAADIDHAKVVWARDRGQAENQKLLAYFHNRDVWLLDPDVVPLRLTAYTPAVPATSN